MALENTLKNIDNEGVYDTLESDYESGHFFFPEGLHRGTKFESRDKHGHLVIYDTTSDQHHLSFTGNMNIDINKVGDLTGWDFSYGIYFDIDGSLEFLISKIKTLYSVVASPDSILAPPGETREDLLSVGLGLGWRSDLIQKLINWQRLFDTFTLYLTYNIMDENYFFEKFKGPGFRVDYLIKARLTKVFHLGLKTGYSMAWTTRSPRTDNESKSDRRLFLNWVTLGLDIGLNF